MRWFGLDWGAPVCKATDQVEVPVGRSCLGCSKEVTVGDDGLLVPLVAEQVTEEPWHLSCFMRSVGVGPDGRLLGTEG